MTATEAVVAYVAVALHNYGPEERTEDTAIKQNSFIIPNYT